MKFLSEAHRKNYEGAMKHLEEQKKRPLNYEEELKRHEEMHEAERRANSGDKKAAGVYLRSAFEAILKQFCFGKVTVMFVIDQSKLKANDFWIATKKYIKDQPSPDYELTLNTRDEIDTLLPLVLNPLNHNDINKNEHGNEIARTITALRTLKKGLNV